MTKDQNSYLERSLNHKNGQTIFNRFTSSSAYSAFQIDELHRHHQNLVGTLHKGDPTVVDRHENAVNCNSILKKYQSLMHRSKQ
ncbi:MAG: hypothetical protein O4805_14070 [Trichodesmium sp. St16_bin2-tuft]|nr:hypothetical protein [Trichodesmium sp. St16_bin2-tuft]